MKHPLDKFQYCPVCGSKTFSINNFKSKKCEACGFTYYANPCSATASFILNDRGELLVAKRGKEPAKGTLDLPGGFVDMDESVEDGMRREIQEETGLTFTEVRYLFSIPNQYLYSDMLIHTIDMFYEVHVGNEVKPVADDDAAALQWLPLAQVNPKDFGLKSISKGVERYLAESLRK
jgi:ADP-ribose pyrophosphatase YjhB (NUDIX family)